MFEQGIELPRKEGSHAITTSEAKLGGGFLDDFEEVNASSGVLKALDARIKHLEKWEDKQNGSLQRMETKIDHMNDRMNGFHDRFDELKDLMYESREKAAEGDQKVNDQRDSKSAQKVTWLISICAILVSFSSVLINLFKK